MRLITSVGLALLLMLGLAATTHLEQGGSAPVPLSMTGLVDPHVEPAQHSAADEQTTPGMWVDSDELLGGVLCAFGLLCGLTLMVLIRRSLQRTPPPTLGRAARAPTLFSTTGAHAHPVVFSLTQLGLSRT